MPPILGHSAALRVLQDAITHDRVHHAWIFHGPPGVGKFTTAVAFAKRLLEGPGLFADASVDGVFEADATWTHPDLHVISKELAAVSNFTTLRNRKQTNIPVDLLREHLVGGWIGSGDSKKYIEPPIGKTALSGGGKIFIVDEAELLAREGQNTLLKTLEEPPPRTQLILITAHEDRLLPTIRSRCQRVAFGPLPQDALESWLSHRLTQDRAAHTQRLSELKAEKKPNREMRTEIQRLETSLASLDPDAQRTTWAVRVAEGAPGRALMAIERGLADWARDLDLQLRSAAAGRMDAELGTLLTQQVETYAKTWVDDHEGASKDAANKAAVRHMLALFGQTCRRGIAEGLKTTQGTSAADTEATIAPWLHGIDLVAQAETQLDANVAVALLLENLVVQFSTQTAGTIGSHR